VRFIKGDKIFNGLKFLSPATVLVFDHQNVLKDVLPDGVPDEGRIEKKEGILCPGFVNAHCHLELSHLKSLIPAATGLPAFGKAVMQLRNTSTIEERISFMREADRQMFANGIVAVGDICNSPESVVAKKSSPILYHSFIELLALDPGRATDVMDKARETMNVFEAGGLRSSLVPHAPYSVSKELMGYIAEFDQIHNLPFSIHNQESPEEEKFLLGENSGFYDVYKFLGIDLSFYKPPGIKGPAYFSDKLPDTQVLLVHNTCSKSEDINAVKHNSVYWCFCPSANQYIEKTLPDFKLFSGHPNNICVGTDSLASNNTLDLLQEACVILDNSDLTLEQVLRAITSNGARALGFDRYLGELMPGRRPGLNQLWWSGGKISLLNKIL
jgi:aminodeoxyfutalosine deaminase